MLKRVRENRANCYSSRHTSWPWYDRLLVSELERCNYYEIQQEHIGLITLNQVHVP